MPLLGKKDELEPEEREAHYLGGIVKRVDDFDLERIAERQRCQKIVYLIQAFGFDLGYGYHWVTGEPRCPELTEVIHNIKEIYDQIEPSRFTDEEHEERFGDFLEYVEPLKQNTERLRIASSLHFLHHRNPDLHPEELVEYLMNGEELEDEEYHRYLHEWRRLKKYDVVE